MTNPYGIAIKSYATLPEDLEHVGDGLPIGEGACSRVYKVRNKRTGQLYALKILSIHKQYEEEVLQEFINELAILGRIHHPSVVRVEDHFLIGGQPALLMEFIEGDSLGALLSQRGYLSTQEVLEVLGCMAEGLVACHNMQVPMGEQGTASETVLLSEHAIIHNDIHLKNIIRTQRSVGGYGYKLIDFGLSFVDSRRVRAEHIENGMLEFKAPEKWQPELGTLSTRSDIYSLGVVLYTLLAGSPPFGWVDHRDVLAHKRQRELCLGGVIPTLWYRRQSAIETREYVYPSRPDYPYWLDALIRKCLALDPRERFRSGRELLAELHRGLQGKSQSEWPELIPKEEPLPRATSSTTLTSELESASPRVETPRAGVAPVPLRAKLNTAWDNLKRIGLIILCATGLVGAIYAGSILLFGGSASPESLDEAEERLRLEEYLAADLAAQDSIGISKIEPYLAFPLDYYGITLRNESAFRKHYRRGIASIKRKEMELDSIVARGERSYMVYRKLRVHKGRTKRNSEVVELFRFDEHGRIVSIRYAED
ncbi:MAG: serine/threonine-protein kinase [Porphyromonas sp.]|nr:serine/threonine-protein kinase [Porphyromonas sp.]